MLSVVYIDHFISIYSSAKSWNITEKNVSDGKLRRKVREIRKCHWAQL